MSENEVLIKNMDKPAVYIANLDKTLTLRLILYSIKKEAEVKNEDLKK